MKAHTCIGPCTPSFSRQGPPQWLPLPFADVYILYTACLSELGTRVASIKSPSNTVIQIGYSTSYNIVKQLNSVGYIQMHDIYILSTVWSIAAVNVSTKHCIYTPAPTVNITRVLILINQHWCLLMTDHYSMQLRRLT